MALKPFSRPLLDYVANDIRGWMGPKFSHLRKNRKNPQPEKMTRPGIEPRCGRREATMLLLVHSGRWSDFNVFSSFFFHNIDNSPERQSAVKYQDSKLNGSINYIPYLTRHQVYFHCTKTRNASLTYYT